MYAPTSDDGMTVVAGRPVGDDVPDGVNVWSR
jgi:hypothetical protein